MGNSLNCTQWKLQAGFGRLIPVAIFCALALSCSQPPEDPTDRPNVVLLFADDLGYGDLGVYGHPTIRTPRLDRMASEGVRLTQFYVAASVCTPSRAGLLTGRLPIRSGMCGGGRMVLFPDSAGGLGQEEITIARAVQSVGYATACIGKWHLGHRHPYLPTDHGFDYYFGIPYSNDMSPSTNPWDGARGFPAVPLMEYDQVIEEEPDQSLLTRRYTEKALSFIEANQDRPFFLYLPYTFPHVPLFASESFLGRSPRGLYGDVVEEIDWSVGQILDKIDSLDLGHRTLVFFTSDNGPWLTQDQSGGSAGLLRDGKGSTWEGGMREPALARWRGTLPAGQLRQQVATSLDLFPTITSLAGWTAGGDLRLDGENILPLLREGTPKENTTVFFYREERLYALRKGPWKAHFITIEGAYRESLIEEHEPPLLFHIEEDPSERSNLAEQYPEIVQELRLIRQQHEAKVTRVPSRLAEKLTP